MESPQHLVPRTRRRASLYGAVSEAKLDRAQRAAIALPLEHPLLVLGEAGYGKTTVAVHRFAHAWRALDRPPRTAAIVPTEGLARLVTMLLRRLGVDVEATTYDRWAAKQARRVFRDLPRRESELVAPPVTRLKRAAALRSALAELAKRPAGFVDDDPDTRRAARRPSRTLARRADLQHLFGDRLLLERVTDEARAIEATLEHTRIQFSRRAEREWSHVTDRARLVAVDGRAMDDGTATTDAHTIDAEDYAVLFELDRMRAAALGGTPAAPPAFDVVLVDEAQELAPLEVALVGRSVAPGGALVVAGDADQHVDPTSSFLGWDAVLAELGRDDFATVRLEVGYRCPPEVTALARAILHGGSPAPAAAGAVAFASERALFDGLGRELEAFRRRDPRASVLVVARTPRLARALGPALARHVPARVVFDGRFLPRGPVQITTVEETRGLEVDVVIVPDATAGDYPDTNAARRALYLAVTRARHQVLLAHVGARTPLLG